MLKKYQFKDDKLTLCKGRKLNKTSLLSNYLILWIYNQVYFIKKFKL